LSLSDDDIGPACPPPRVTVKAARPVIRTKVPVAFAAGKKILATLRPAQNRRPCVPFFRFARHSSP
jgi:hypothetical protein